LKVGEKFEEISEKVQKVSEIIFSNPCLSAGRCEIEKA
jgi:hypothetical protein